MECKVSFSVQIVETKNNLHQNNQFKAQLAAAEALIGV